MGYLMPEKCALQSLAMIMYVCYECGTVFDEEGKEVLRSKEEIEINGSSDFEIFQIYRPNAFTPMSLICTPELKLVV